MQWSIYKTPVILKRCKWCGLLWCGEKMRVPALTGEVGSIWDLFGLSVGNRMHQRRFSRAHTAHLKDPSSWDSSQLATNCHWSSRDLMSSSSLCLQVHSSICTQGREHIHIRFLKSLYQWCVWPFLEILTLLICLYVTGLNYKHPALNGPVLVELLAIKMHIPQTLVKSEICAAKYITLERTIKDF